MEIKDLKIESGKSYATREVHFTGGLRGAPTNRGWALFPVSDDKNSDAIVFPTSTEHFQFATQQCGVSFLGVCVKYRSDTHSAPMDVWDFGNRGPKNEFGAADSWGFVGHRAYLAGDTSYSEPASYIGTSLRTAGLRLRDVSDGYHNQLAWAFAEKRSPSTWFSNAALHDLYGNFHSLASELSSARDHLAKIVAIHIGAPDRIDSSARLEEWLDKSPNRSHQAHPIAGLLLSALGTKTSPGWLRRLGDIRNEMLHRVPMAANKSVAGLVLEQVATTLGPVSRIRLGEPLSKTPLSLQAADPLVELARLSISLEDLCRAVMQQAKYPAEPLLFTSAPAK